MTENKFRELLNRPESSTLDFKSEMYDFSNDADNVIISKFVKDVLSFTNTIRESSSYVIFGVKELEDSNKELIGISKNIDDAILQDKVKNKIYPLPKFNYSTIIYSKKLFGILEFPVRRYDFPVSSVVKLRGLEIGRTYYRQGTSNTEALTLEILKINDWLQSLPKTDTEFSVQNLIATFLKRLLTQNEKLSEVLPELFVFAKNNNFSDLKYFCELEIKGFDVSSPELRSYIQEEYEKFRYRVQIIKISLDEIIQVYHRTPEQLKQELDNSENFFNAPYFNKDSILTLENFLNRTDGFAKIKMKVNDVLPNYKNDYPSYGYLFNSNFVSLYQNIRQKLIDLIMELR